MLVHGDKVRTVRCQEAIAGLRRGVSSSPSTGAGSKDLVVEAGEVCQGILDGWWEARSRVDRWGGGERWCSALMLAIAGRRYEEALTLLEQPVNVPERIRCKVPEGFAWYGLDPQSYVDAALRIAGGRHVVVIGIRSIGVTLGALVADALGPRTPFLTLRLVGHPFDRAVRVDSSVERLLKPWLAAARFAIVDEGPGLSGSTFRGTARWLEGLGVEPERIHLFPSHEGLPPMARDDALAWWKTARRHVSPGPEIGDEIGGGEWRRLYWLDETRWPPSNPSWERRKALFPTGAATSVARFAGLGAQGQRKLGRARALAEAGYCPRVWGLRDGYLQGEWVSEAKPTLRSEVRRIPVELVGRYLGFVASSFPAESPEEGASLQELTGMAVNNALELGFDQPDAWERWTAILPDLQARSRPVRVDARLQPWEWIERSDGRWFKTDALDHHVSHELPGAQDAAWDVAGAIVELELDDGAGREIAARVAAATGRAVDPELIELLRGCYLAFHAGYWDMTARSVGGSEVSRALRERDRYVGLLSRWLGLVSSAR